MFLIVVWILKVFVVVVVVVFLCNRSTLAYASVAKENEWVTI